MKVPLGLPFPSWADTHEKPIKHKQAGLGVCGPGHGGQGSRLCLKGEASCQDQFPLVPCESSLIFIGQVSDVNS